MNKLNELKNAMLNGTAVATHFEEAIKEEGLTLEVMGLIHAYYYLPNGFKEDFDQEAKNFADALAFKSQRKADDEDGEV